MNYTLTDLGNDIRDDVVMTTRYSGFWLDISKPEEQTAETVNYVMGGNHR